MLAWYIVDIGIPQTCLRTFFILNTVGSSEYKIAKKGKSNFSVSIC